MEVLFEPEKIVTKFEDIEAVVNAVLERMDEPDLNSKRITRFVLEQDNFIKVFALFSGKTADKLQEALYEKVDGFYFDSPLIQDKFLIFMKSADASKVFKTYFHELGHIASVDFIRQSRLSRGVKTRLFEMLAISFESWACEEYNRYANGFKFIDPLLMLYCEVELQSRMEQINNKTPIVRAAYDNLLKFYNGIKASSFREVYKSLKAQCISRDTPAITGI